MSMNKLTFALLMLGSTLSWSVKYTKNLQDLLAKFQASGNLNDWY